MLQGIKERDVDDACTVEIPVLNEHYDVADLVAFPFRSRASVSSMSMCRISDDHALKIESGRGG